MRLGNGRSRVGAMQRDLVVRAQGGDHDAFAALAADSLDRLDGTARLVLRDPDRAKDAVQEALVHAWRQLPSLRDPERFDAWLYRLLLNACYDEARRGRWRRFEVSLPFVRPPAIGDDEEAIAERDEIERGFRRLAPEERAILACRYFLDLSVPQIAETLRIPEGTAKSRLNRATAALRAALAAEARGHAAAAGTAL